MWSRPTHPLGLGHPAEDRMRLPRKPSRMRGDAVQQRFELRDVLGEVGRSRASELLIDLRFRGDAGRPSQRHVEGDPFDDRAFDQAAGVAHGFLTHRHAKRVAQMADHLVRRHPSPAAPALWTHLPQPVKDLRRLLMPGQRLHHISPSTPGFS